MTSYLSITSLDINTSDVTNHQSSCQQCLLHNVVSWLYRIDVVPFHSLNAFGQVLKGMQCFDPRQPREPTLAPSSASELVPRGILRKKGLLFWTY